MSQTRTVGTLSSHDEATKQQTATLADVAAAAAHRLANRDASDYNTTAETHAPHHHHHDTRHHGYVLAAAGAYPPSISAADAHMQDATDLFLHASTQHQQRQQAHPTAVSTTLHHSTSTEQQQHPAATSTPHSSAAAPVVSVSMSTIGFGIDPSLAVLTDATEAAYRAVRDAMERSAVRLPAARHHLSLHLKVGVPSKPGSNQPMDVDTSRLTSLLPPSVPLQPMQVVVGGLLIGNHNNDHNDNDDSKQQSSTSEASATHPTICTAVACVTLEQAELQQPSEESTKKNSERAVAPAPAPWTTNHAMGLGGHMAMPQQAHHYLAPATHHHGMHPATSAMAAAFRQTRNPPIAVDGNVAGARGAYAAATSNMPPLAPAHPRGMHHSSSMEMLAIVSGEIRDRQLSGPEAYDKSRRPQPEGSDASADGATGYNYKKLPPGVTPKNNRRLFVKHQYRDYSQEEPMPEEIHLVRSEGHATKTPNAAFPLKLHETLTQIEQDGFGHIIGWLPHGRSFKIHEQKQFVEVVLPKYFVMTKKSSFLRQLNLYGFNRLSGVGPDQGSYYHEKFLRGLKFLCRRMARQKVNGNGIRAAGNPDEEPELSKFPSCPPSKNGDSGGNASINGADDGDADESSVPKENADENKSDSNGNNENPYTQMILSQLRPYSSIVHQPDPAGSKDSDDDSDDDDGNNGNNDDGSPWKNKYAILKKPGPSSMNSFPLKLQRLLDKAEAEGDMEIISWLPHGRAFLVHDTDKFVSTIMTEYFNQTKYSSFQRQLHMYKFKRITAGPDKGAYHHKHCQRGKPHLCYKMTRTRVNGKGCRRPGNPDKEPDFYAMERLPPIPNGTVIEIPTAGLADEDADATASGDEVQVQQV